VGRENPVAWVPTRFGPSYCLPNVDLGNAREFAERTSVVKPYGDADGTGDSAPPGAAITMDVTVPREPSYPHLPNIIFVPNT